MTNMTEPSPEPVSVSGVSQEAGPGRKAYEAPALVEWGSILELTAGGLASDEDGDFTGSGGV